MKIMLVRILITFVLFGNNEATFCSCGGGSQIFTSDGTFIVPARVSRVRVVAIGGGGGGTNGHMPGGGGGYVKCGTFDVTSGSTIHIKVGKGGSGAKELNSNDITGNTAGSASKFGTMLEADGGSTTTVLGEAQARQGSAGGSGSGCACWSIGSDGICGSGGSGGSNGGGAGTGMCIAGAAGQGTVEYAACLKLATIHTLTAGSGGMGGVLRYAGQTLYWAPGGGGGGILIDGIGPSAGNGGAPLPFFGSGGQGYGAGGGGGGWRNEGGVIRYAGGKGADGLVYIEWN